MKTTGIFLFIALFAAFSYSSAAIVDLTGKWYVLSVRGLGENLEHPKSWVFTMSKKGRGYEGVSTFVDDKKAETINRTFALTSYDFAGVDTYNVYDPTDYPLDFLPFNLDAVDNKDGTISLIEDDNDLEYGLIHFTQ